MPALTLRLPEAHEEAEFLRAYHATAPEYPDSPHFLHYHTKGMSFGRYLEVLAEQARGVNVPDGFVQATFLFAFVGDRIVGRASIRHALNDFLLQQGGHIGYVVVPEFRRRGHATEILRQALRIARDRLGIRRVLVTCDDDNIGSIRVIEKNGGVLENIVGGKDPKKSKRRYWIEPPHE